MGLLSNMHTLPTFARFDKAQARALMTRYAHNALPWLREISDPRGRCNRKAFLHIALAFLMLQLGVAGLLSLLNIETSLEFTFLWNAPMFWIGTTVCVKRLHDVGHRGWWIPGAFAIWFVAAFVITVVVSMVLGEEALAQGQPAFFALFGIMTLPAFGALLWLHTAPSDAKANVYGPIPGDSGLSMPPRREKAANSLLSSGALVA